jgi:hypothetical protein
MKTTYVTMIALFLRLVVASPTFKADGDGNVEGEGNFICLMSR